MLTLLPGMLALLLPLEPLFPARVPSGASPHGIIRSTGRSIGRGSGSPARRQLETTFQAVRPHQCVETHSKWSELDVVNPHQTLMGFSSRVTSLAHRHNESAPPAGAAGGAACQ
jgi:hypothetical protein